jgi:hypothetical protein
MWRRHFQMAFRHVFKRQSQIGHAKNLDTYPHWLSHCALFIVLFRIGNSALAAHVRKNVHPKFWRSTISVRNLSMKKSDKKKPREYYRLVPNIMA